MSAQALAKTSRFVEYLSRRLRITGTKAAESGPKGSTQDRIKELAFPYGVFSLRSAPEDRRIGVAVSPDYILDCRELKEAEILPPCMAKQDMIDFLQQGHTVWGEVREKIQNLILRTLLVDSEESEKTLRAESRPINLESALVPHAEVQMRLPCHIGDYTDFFVCPQHACRGNWERLRPNWMSLPVAYHGRASSVVAGGTWRDDHGDGHPAFPGDDHHGGAAAHVHRPWGQFPVADGSSGTQQRLEFLPTRRLDYEVEVGALIGGPENALGDAVGLGESSPEHAFAAAERRVFGFVLLNDLSARDIQYWEMAPLGPFLGKSFASVISPWVVPKAALDANCRRRRKPFLGSQKDVNDLCEADFESLPYPDRLRRFFFDIAGSDAGSVPGYLRIPSAKFDYEYDVEIDVGIRLCPDSDRDLKSGFYPIAKTNLSAMHWTWEQMVLHHASNGCNLRAGDLLGSGTLSVPDASPVDKDPGRYGCLQESTFEGRTPLELEAEKNSEPGPESGETELKPSIRRLYLENDDVCTFRSPGVFGECSVRILKQKEYNVH